MQGLLLSLGLLAAGCSSAGYQPPESGPTGTVTVASSCLANPASFFARINRQRTQTYGCNQTASWPVVPGHIELIVQVEEARYTIEPLTIEFDLEADQCASFLLRQRDGYDLEVFGIGPCED